MRRVTILLLIIFIAMAGVGGLVFLSYRFDIGHARAAVEGAAIAQTPAGPIEYAERGDGPPLLSIHGAGGGWDQGLANATALVGDGYRVIAPSRFGYLGTPVPADTSPAAQADAHAALLSVLAVDDAIVVGASAGARSAVELALRHPDKVSALILIVPGTYSPESPVAVEGSPSSAIVLRLVNAGADFAWWAAEKIAPSVLIRFLGVEPDLLRAASREERDQLMSVVKSVNPLSLRFPGINVDGADLQRPSFEQISAPTLVITARDDLFNTLPAAQFAAGTIPNAELVVYDTGGHLLVGHQDDTRDAIGAFLSKATMEHSTAR